MFAGEGPSSAFGHAGAAAPDATQAWAPAQPAPPTADDITHEFSALPPEARDALAAAVAASKLVAPFASGASSPSASSSSAGLAAVQSPRGAEADALRCVRVQCPHSAAGHRARAGRRQVPERGVEWTVGQSRRLLASLAAALRGNGAQHRTAMLRLGGQLAACACGGAGQISLSSSRKEKKSSL